MEEKANLIFRRIFIFKMGAPGGEIPLGYQILPEVRRQIHEENAIRGGKGYRGCRAGAFVRQFAVRSDQRAADQVGRHISIKIGDFPRSRKYGAGCLDYSIR